MERQPKIDLVIKAIEKAKAITPNGQQVKVYLSEIINRVRLEELQNILTILQNDEKILMKRRFPDHLLDLPPGYVSIDLLTGKKSSPATEYFTVVVNKKFDKWCTQYWVDSIDIMTREKAESLVLDAMKKEAISQQDLDTLLQYANDDVEGFLEVVQKIGRNPVMDGLMKRLSPECTPEDLEQIFDKSPLAQAEQKEKDLPEDETIYRITFTPTREILLNNSYQIAVPDFDRENEQVFSYLYNHPNKKFTTKQLEAELNISLIKTPHKIVENLGFTRVLRAVFFNVSKGSIQFKNPVKSGDLSPSVLLQLNSLIAKD